MLTDILLYIQPGETGVPLGSLITELRELRVDSE